MFAKNGLMNDGYIFGLQEISAGKALVLFYGARPAETQTGMKDCLPPPARI
jgi:hypothetical protein